MGRRGGRTGRGTAPQGIGQEGDQQVHTATHHLSTHRRMLQQLWYWGDYVQHGAEDVLQDVRFECGRSPNKETDGFVLRAFRERTIKIRIC